MKLKLKLGGKRKVVQEGRGAEAAIYSAVPGKSSGSALSWSTRTGLRLLESSQISPTDTVRRSLG